MAGRPKKRQKMRQRLANKLLYGNPYTDDEWEWLKAEQDRVGANEEWSPSYQREKRRYYEQKRVEGMGEAFKEQMKNLTALAGAAYEKALLEYLEAEDMEISDKDLSAIRTAALKAAARVEDRHLGKAVQTSKIEGTIQHEHSVLERMAQAPELLEFNAEQPVIEAEVVDDGAESN